VAYDEELADRVRELVGQESGLVEKRMFGGLAMMIDGNMAVVVSGSGGLMIRVDPAEFAQLQAEPGAQATVMRGRPMRGWISVDAAACAQDADLIRWVDRGVRFARRLPAK
jgi:TfoX/Sxy family transcriptional regulator of competence genes